MAGKKKGTSRKGRSAKQRANDKRLGAMARARHAAGGSTRKRSSAKRGGAKRGAKRSKGHASGSVAALARKVDSHIAADHKWKRGQAVINTIVVGEVKALSHHTGHHMSPALRSLPAGPGGPARRLGSGR